MFPDPSTTRIIHDTMIKEEMERHFPELRRPRHEPGRRPRRASGLRQSTARALLRLADRIAPVPECPPTRQPA